MSQHTIFRAKKWWETLSSKKKEKISLANLEIVNRYNREDLVIQALYRKEHEWLGVFDTMQEDSSTCPDDFARTIFEYEDDDGKRYKIVKEPLQVGDMYWMVLTGVVHILKDKNYGLFHPNKLGAWKVIELKD